MFVILMLVITSYSIHYTKLYDNTKPIWNRYDDKNDVMMGGQVNGMWHTPTGTTWDWAGPDAVGEYLARWVAGAHRPIGDNNKANGIRITSYNVCYTKLLR